MGLTPALIRGYERSVSTHTDAARAVQAGKADAAIGIQAAAREANLGFIPLFEERYDLIFPEEVLHQVGPLLDHLQTASFRRELNALTGYNTAHSGEQVQL